MRYSKNQINKLILKNRRVFQTRASAENFPGGVYGKKTRKIAKYTKK